MGESTCLVHVQPFCYASGLSHETKESNPMHALGQSISFGRFMSDSLAWEKWSTFNHNRYVEEAERYSRPGSVARKKAFFEAHYMKLAAQRTAALLEQADNSASGNVPKQETEESVDINKIAFVQDSTHASSEEVEEKIVTSVTSSEEQEDKVSYSKTEVEISANRCDSNTEANEPELESTVVSENENFAGNSKEVELQSKFEENHDHNHMVVAEKNFESIKELILIPNQKAFVPSLNNSGILSSPAIPRASISSINEVDFTPASKEPATAAADKKRITPKSLYMSVNFTPLKELNRLTASVMKKIENSRAGSNSTKISKDIPIPLRTPTSEPKTSFREHNLVTPPSTQKEVTQTPMDATASGNRKAGTRWRLLSSENKTRYPILSSPFNLRTEERAARRKKNLEEKFDANEVQKVQLRTKLKEKAESEIRKLGQTFCFKARPLPEFYKERKGPNNEMKQVPFSHIEKCNKQERSAPSPSGVESKSSLPPQRPSTFSNRPKRVEGKNGEYHGSNSKSTTHENRSPNIQHSTLRHKR